jgi:hypothetical protein
MILESISILPPVSWTTAAAVSSQEVSMAKILI